MEKEIVFVLLDEFADWEAAFLAPALCSGVMPGRRKIHVSRRRVRPVDRRIARNARL